MHRSIIQILDAINDHSNKLPFFLCSTLELPEIHTQMTVDFT